MMMMMKMQQLQLCVREMDDKNDDDDKGDGVDDNYVDNSICIYLVIFVCHHHSVLKSGKKYKVNVIIK